MAKKATGTKKPSAEILDDNGTLIATSDAPGEPGAMARAGGEGEALAKSDKRDISGPS